jgi:hypothetical protein
MRTPSHVLEAVCGVIGWFSPRLIDKKDRDSGLYGSVW